MNQMAARAFLVGFTLLTLLTLFQQSFHTIKLAGLQGAFDTGVKPEFSLDQWFNGQFQQKYDHYLKYNTAFNGELVRLRNQVDYSVFGNINTILTLGKENYIFDPNYIIALNGTDLLTDSAKRIKTEAINNTLTILHGINVPLYVCFTPNKANYYSQYLPEKLSRSNFTNRMFFDSVLTQSGVTAIDFDKWFLSLKDTSTYPLVPKYGAHWTTYGAWIAADSLVKQLNTDREEKITSFSLTKIELSDKPRFTDDDYLASLNLMIKWKSPQMAYPQLQFHPGNKPTALIISDSFIWNFYDLGIIQNCFSERSQVRYYNKTIFDAAKNNMGPVTDVKIAALQQCDFILIIASDPSLKDFGFGFFESINQLALHD